MKRKDLTALLLTAVVLAPFFVFSGVYDFYTTMNLAHPYISAFVKFAILATFGEMLGLRIKTGNYNEKGFGIIARAIVWGFFGVWIAIAMKVFATAVPTVVESFGIDGVREAMMGDFSLLKLLGAFSISVMMNTTFAPVFMTLHKISDTNIINHNGSIRALFSPINMGAAFAAINWKVQWGFVFKKTIPFFWIPAHTITFMLPTQYQVLFAAFLGIALGVILSVAAILSRKEN